LEVLLEKIESSSKAKKCGSENRNNGPQQGTLISCCKYGKKQGISRISEPPGASEEKIYLTMISRIKQKTELQLLT
jgi:hypothetical protein